MDILNLEKCSFGTNSLSGFDDDEFERGDNVDSMKGISKPGRIY